MIVFEFVDAPREAFQSLCYGQMQQRDLDYISERISTSGRNIREDARWLMDRSKETIERFTDSNILNLIRKVNTGLKGLSRKNIIQFLDSAEEISTAPQVMQTLIAIRPEVHMLLKKRKLHNYGIEIKDYELILKTHRTVYNGLTQYDEESKKFVNIYEYGINEIDGRPLSVAEQLDLIATHDIFEDSLSNNIDATSLDLDKFE